MFTKTVAALAIVGSAAAYVPPMMSLSANRREVVAGAAAASVIAPLAANAKIEKGDAIKAPFITLFDNRGCEVKKNNYSGPKANGAEDDQCIKLTMESVKVSEDTAAKKLGEFIGLKATAVGVKSISGVTKKY
uniref:Phycoerythrin alpha subunit L2 n=1 Tax=Chroomonas sp. M1312 TaxID=179792 RepID=A0A067XP71_9CRYP|nr:phycoerythrin alpha subunit L2 [Chroomonas sp. M1312]